MKSEFLTITFFIALLLFSSLFGFASAADASGNIDGILTCTGNSVVYNGSLVLSAFMGDVPVYGNWEITSVDSLGNTISVTGYLNAGTIGQGNFNLEGIATSDAICGIEVPSEVTVIGVCGSSGSLQIASHNDLRGEYLGNIECTS